MINDDQWWLMIFNEDDDIVGSGLVLSNLPELFRHFYDVDPDRMIEGVLEYIPIIPIPYLRGSDFLVP